jgi:hypothetical protein
LIDPDRLDAAPEGGDSPGQAEFTRAMEVSVSAGQQVANQFRTLSRHKRLRIASVFRRQLLSPGRP